MQRTPFTLYRVKKKKKRRKRRRADKSRRKRKRKKNQPFKNFLYIVLLTITRRLCVNYRKVRIYQRRKRCECRCKCITYNLEIYRTMYKE